jgi:murein DD-endopeptidase MepM/ murein hydrolase activator NlpD
VPDRSHHARHRASRQVTSKPRRLIAGLALPTAAAVALTFISAGAAVATSSKTQSATFKQKAAAMTSPQPTLVDPAMTRARHLKEIERDQAVARAIQLKEDAANLAVVRATAVARGVERKKLAAAAAVAKHAALVHGWRLPIKNPVTTSGFGYRWGRLHAGEDFAVSIGTPLASMSTGTVAFAGAQSGYGNMVEIRYWDGTVSRYGHMSSVSVTDGETVLPGEVVGQSGNSGHSTGPHLHLEIHPNGGQAIDPLPWLASHHVAV